MANRFPLVFDSTNSGRIKELPSGDNLNLTGSSIVDVVNITSSGTLTASTINVQTLNISGGGSIGAVALSNDYNDLDNKPVLFSGSYNDLSDLPVGVDWATVYNVPPIPTKLSQLENDTNFANSESLNIYATQIIGFAPVAVSNSYKDLTDAGDLLTKSQLVGNQVNVEVTNTGDLVGSVYAEDSSLLVDHINSKLIGNIETSLISGNSSLLTITTSGLNQTEDITIATGSAQGTITIAADSIILDGSTTTGTLRSVLIGDVYADDSTHIISAADGSVVGPVDGILRGNIEKLPGENLTIQSNQLICTSNGDITFDNSSRFSITSTGGVSITATDNLVLAAISGYVTFAPDTNVQFGANTAIDFTGAVVSGISLPPSPETDTLASVTARGATTVENITVNGLTTNADALVQGDLTVNGNLLFDANQSIGTLAIPVNTIWTTAINATAVYGDVTGNVTGDLLGDVTGDVTGNVTGSVYSINGDLLIDAVNKQISAEYLIDLPSEVAIDINDGGNGTRTYANNGVIGFHSNGVAPTVQLEVHGGYTKILVELLLSVENPVSEKRNSYIDIQRRINGGAWTTILESQMAVHARWYNNGANDVVTETDLGSKLFRWVDTHNQAAGAIIEYRFINSTGNRYSNSDTMTVHYYEHGANIYAKEIK